jgi:site-specific DNA recombinase
MSAARRKGKWVGGMPVLGYDVDAGGGRLVINEKEAKQVRKIFELYAKDHSLQIVVSELCRLGWNTKSRESKRGIRHNGQHDGSIYPGEHAAIVEAGVWEAINAEFTAGRRDSAYAARTKQNALLAGLLICKSCERPMIATYTSKRGMRYRYYVCQGARQNGWNSCSTKSVAATMIEDSVLLQLRATLNAEETRKQLQIPASGWQTLEAGSETALVRNLL